MKKRPSRNELLRAGEFARNLLKEKGLFSERSIIDEIEKTVGAPILPGYAQRYVPRRKTIEISKMVLYSIAKVWNDKVKDARAERISDFYVFLVKAMGRSDMLIEQMYRDTIEKAKSELVGMNLPSTRENTVGVRRYLMDSFAVYPNLQNSKSSVSDYLEWFIQWSKELSRLAAKLPDEPQEIEKRALKNRLLERGSSQ